MGASSNTATVTNRTGGVARRAAAAVAKPLIAELGSRSRGALSAPVLLFPRHFG
jgi:hypothetical protein